MAVAENAGVRNGTAGQNLNNNIVSSETNDLERTSSKPRNESVGFSNTKDSNFQSQNKDHQSVNGKSGETGGLSNGRTNGTQMQNGFDMNQSGGYGDDQIRHQKSKSNEVNDMSALVEMLSKLNPMAEEFVPPSLVNHHGFFGNGFGINANNFIVQTINGSANGPTNRRKKNYNQGRRRMNSRTSMAQQEEIIRKTVYVSDIDQQVTEEQLAGLFIHCGQVVDCRICGDPNSVLRFAFVEFTDEEDARNALSLSGTVLGYYPLRVLPSKTAIAPVNPTFLPRSEDERETCARTIYCTNIDKKITQADVKLFFESFCGEVHRLRLLGDYHHSTRIAFVEFAVGSHFRNVQKLQSGIFCENAKNADATYI
ncbi:POLYADENYLATE-BINDING PROTEIN-INTERACTING PROTEIN 10 [Salix purpurea]|uniref:POLYADENYLATE-BINDING PROTEIN-INTERACTING PROTEIN 10 n=1 Tax=Salix purpurea TaxID=77065 RepID=A0A9Q0W4A4_SALPP|nr:POLYADENYLATE-BINDING PROTEIN-INTERACTING PROTEIN 10 [Salix purpurea]